MKVLRLPDLGNERLSLRSHNLPFSLKYCHAKMHSTCPSEDISCRILEFEGLHFIGIASTSQNGAWRISDPFLMAHSGLHDLLSRLAARSSGRLRGYADRRLGTYNEFASMSEPRTESGYEVVIADIAAPCPIELPKIEPALAAHLTSRGKENAGSLFDRRLHDFRLQTQSSPPNDDGGDVASCGEVEHELVISCCD
ncbi:hypothetical protein, partial [Rhizobium sp. BK650]|uniref:hypothetical protein n=1 Tax=Rhizobium sp. BK650 TaxID=2586990 RepID=UPI001AED5CF3